MLPGVTWDMECIKADSPVLKKDYIDKLLRAPINLGLIGGSSKGKLNSNLGNTLLNRIYDITKGL